MDRGGVELGTLEMAEYITHQGCPALVASAPGKMVESLLRVGAEHYALPLHRRTPWHIVANAFALAGIIKKGNVAVVHARSRAPAWAAYLACKITGTPFVTTFHGTYGLKGFGKKFYNSVMVRGVRVIAISQFIADHIARHYHVPADKVRIVHRGFDPRRLNPAAIDNKKIEALWEEWGVPAATPVIMMPGRVTRWKGHEVFLDALGLMKNLPWRAVIVGGYDSREGFYYSLWHQAEKLGIRERLIFTGDRADMDLMYSAADVIMAPAIAPEAFGRVAVEAQAMGRPVIASAHGGAIETIRSGETGWLVRPGDAKRLALAMTDAITDLVRLKQMGEAGRKWVLENFSTSAMCAGEFSVYRDVLRMAPATEEEKAAS